MRWNLPAHCTELHNRDLALPPQVSPGYFWSPLSGSHLCELESYLLVPHDTHCCLFLWEPWFPTPEPTSAPTADWKVPNCTVWALLISVQNVPCSIPVMALHRHQGFRETGHLSLCLLMPPYSSLHLQFFWWSWALPSPRDMLEVRHMESPTTPNIPEQLLPQRSSIALQIGMHIGREATSPPPFHLSQADHLTLVFLKPKSAPCSLSFATIRAEEL